MNNEHIIVGGSYTCEHCNRRIDGSDIHICPEAQKVSAEVAGEGVPERIWLTVFSDDQEPRCLMANWRTSTIGNAQGGDYVATRPHHKVAYVPEDRSTVESDSHNTPWPVCPITRRPFFMNLHHDEIGEVPTFGGPFDSYTIPEMDDDGELRCERYDHDAGFWIEGGEPTGLWIVRGQPARVSPVTETAIALCSKCDFCQPVKGQETCYACANGPASHSPTVDEAAELKQAVRDYFNIDPAENAAEWCAASNKLLRLAGLPVDHAPTPVVGVDVVCTAAEEIHRTWFIDARKGQLEKAIRTGTVDEFCRSFNMGHCVSGIKAIIEKHRLAASPVPSKDDQEGDLK